MIRSIALACLTGAVLTVAPVVSVAADSASPGPGHRAGVSLITPAGINFVYEANLSFATITASGMHWGESDDSAAGAQLGVSFYRRESDSRFRSLNLIAGTSRLEDEHWDYVGVEAMIAWDHFFLAPGLTRGSGTYSSPQLSLQLGWLWSL